MEVSSCKRARHDDGVVKTTTQSQGKRPKSRSVNKDVVATVHTGFTSLKLFNTKGDLLHSMAVNHPRRFTKIVMVSNEQRAYTDNTQDTVQRVVHHILLVMKTAAQDKLLIVNVAIHNSKAFDEDCVEEVFTTTCDDDDDGSMVIMPYISREPCPVCWFVSNKPLKNRTDVAVRSSLDVKRSIGLYFYNEARIAAVCTALYPNDSDSDDESSDDE